MTLDVTVIVINTNAGPTEVCSLCYDSFPKDFLKKITIYCNILNRNPFI